MLTVAAFSATQPVVGNELHYLFECPSITPIMEPMYVPSPNNLGRKKEFATSGAYAPSPNRG
jgi:hypothetical protein